MADLPPAPAADGGGGRRRFRGVLAYDGSRYHGWAKQPGLPTVEAAVLEALATITGDPGITVTCAGRTDSGVHARGQVVHFDAADVVPEARLLRGLNALLPPDIRFRGLAAAPDGFDARFSALWRHYRYQVTDEVPDPLTRHTVLAVRRPLDVAAMDEAVAALVGEHDFESFCKPRPMATTVRAVLSCRWQRLGSGVAALDIRADAFCHSMVRSVVGASLMVGEGRRRPEWVRGLLENPGRATAAPVAPPHGLVLTEVGYPPPQELAQRALQTRQMRGVPGPRVADL